VVTINRVLAAFRSTLTLPVSNCGAPGAGSRTSFRQEVLRVSPSLRATGITTRSGCPSDDCSAMLPSATAETSPGWKRAPASAAQAKLEIRWFRAKCRKAIPRSVGQQMPSSGTRVSFDEGLKRLQALSSKFHAAASKRLRARDAGCGKLRAFGRPASSAASCISSV
jgi:hypothetical protein